ncbi:MAG: hypothetical protein JWL92_536 [Candidatus Nomurabacteria bacterium]|nr:hypothetical protein [Candidatus Nomurabacteria bacterium]
MEEARKTISYHDAILFGIEEIEEKHRIYGSSWIILRLSSLMDQIFIKLCRIRTIQEKKEQRVKDPMQDEFIGIFNYCIFAKINIKNQLTGKILENEYNNAPLKCYKEALNDLSVLYGNKNHDYGEAWRDMRISSFVDLSLCKALRFKQIYTEDTRPEKEKLSQYDEIFSDIANYAIFAKIKIEEGSNPMF